MGMNELSSSSLLNICHFLTVPEILTLSHASKSLRMDKEDVELWYSLAEQWDVPMSIARSPKVARLLGAGARSTRSSDSAKRSFFVRWRQRVVTSAMQRDMALGKFYESMQQRGDRLKAAKGLLSSDYPINWGSELGLLANNTALNFAARCGKANVVQWLVRSLGADITIADTDGFTPLHNACWRGDEDTVAFLLKQPAVDLAYFQRTGSSLDEHGRLHGPYTPLQWAETRGHSAVARMIQKRIASLEAVAIGHGAASSAGAPLASGPSLGSMDSRSVDGAAAIGGGGGTDATAGRQHGPR